MPLRSISTGRGRVPSRAPRGRPDPTPPRRAVRMRQTALTDLDPLVARLDVDLAGRRACTGAPRLAPMREAGQSAPATASIIASRSARDSGPASDPPQIELMRLAGVQPIDRVAAIEQARADQQHASSRAADHEQRGGIIAEVCVRSSRS